ncbi:MAG: hypothetical protein GJ680_00470 [Alteromonadaceae bacterium]|nr:hypothetical protein [Alteromonadaceae bacterium]
MQTPDDLQKIWQTQTSYVPSEKEVKALWRKNLWNQWGYVALDVITWLAVIWFFPKMVTNELHIMQQIWLYTFLGLGFVYTIYFNWLRRFSFRFNVQTMDYLNLLTQQKQSDLTIARTSKKLIVFMTLAFFIWYPIFAYVKELSMHEFLISMLKSSVFLAVVGGLVYWWAHWFQNSSQRFLDKLANMRDLQTKSE